MVCMLLEEDCVPKALSASLLKPLPTAREVISTPESLDSSNSQVAVPNLPICQIAVIYCLPAFYFLALLLS